MLGGGVLCERCLVGRMAKGLRVMQKGWGVLWFPVWRWGCMLDDFLIENGWLTYVQLSSMTEKAILGFDLLFVLLSLVPKRKGIYQTYTAFCILRSFISELIMRMFLPQRLPFGFESGIHAHNAPHNIPIAILSNPVAYDNTSTSISSRLLFWAI